MKFLIALALSTAYAADSDCADSDDWAHQNREGLGCKWVSEYAVQRCKVNGNINGERVLAQDACLYSCGKCEEETGVRRNAKDLFQYMCPHDFIPPNKVPCDEAFEQSPADITVGAIGELGPNLPTSRSRYQDIDKCAANVHWHLGSEHYNKGTFDVRGDKFLESLTGKRKLAGDVTPGYFCNKDAGGYDENDPMYTTEYEWEYCENMHVGYTYEVHWPHSDATPCGMMSDGLGGLFCLKMPTKAGVEGQVFVIVNDDSGKYDQPRLIEHMVDVTLESDIAKYTGSSTGTSHDNEVCSPYNVQWQVDRACHKVSARSFDAMCKVMKEVHGMYLDLFPHGSRVLVDPAFVSSEPMTRKLRGSAPEGPGYTWH
mmetsp:Transcript_30147/g.93339  ORF Transcript_30147/g.93339 Transcript_30147/m.93339 type:complete len:371 (+) Transcript_30147:65-1177(+)